ncbi:TIR domain-containing protein [Mesorhizobium sp. 43Arga]
MARHVFFSFHFDNDFWRTQQVRNINALQGQSLYSANDWEAVKRKGDAAIEKWIADQMHGKTCAIVLIGAETYKRPWVIHEIAKAWNDKRGVLGIRINRLLDVDGNSSLAGESPFEKVNFAGSQKTLAGIAPLKTPSGADSKAVYASIADNIEEWIEEAIRVRANN